MSGDQGRKVKVFHSENIRAAQARGLENIRSQIIVKDHIDYIRSYQIIKRIELRQVRTGMGQELSEAHPAKGGGGRGTGHNEMYYA